MRKLAGAMVALVSGAFLGSCGAVRPSQFYRLEIPSDPPASVGTFPVTLLIGRLDAPHLYRDTRLVYRSSATQMNTYEYHRWVEPPTDMLQAILMRTLRASGKYQSVQSQGSNARGDYIVRGRLHQFEEVDDGAVSTRVAFEIELYSQESGTTVWTHYYAGDEPVGTKSVPAVVDALNRNVQRGMAEATAGLEQYFAALKK